MSLNKILDTIKLIKERQNEMENNKDIGKDKEKKDDIKSTERKHYHIKKNLSELNKLYNWGF